MAFKKGHSGNPNGRPKGALSRRSQLSKLLEPKAKELVDKMLELALGGDVNALRLCIERLIPKIQREPITIELPSELNPESVPQLKVALLRTALEGQISTDEAEKLIRLIGECSATKDSALGSLSIAKTTDAVEASRIYQELMRQP